VIWRQRHRFTVNCRSWCLVNSYLQLSTRYITEALRQSVKASKRHTLYVKVGRAYHRSEISEALCVPLEGVDDVRDRLRDCATDIRNWCESRRLQLNEDNTELASFGLVQLAIMEQTMSVGASVISNSHQWSEISALRVAANLRSGLRSADIAQHQQPSSRDVLQRLANGLFRMPVPTLGILYLHCFTPKLTPNSLESS